MAVMDFKVIRKPIKYRT